MTEGRHETQPGATRVGFIGSLRRKLARGLAQFQSAPASGDIRQNTQSFINDGVDYSMPAALPQSVVGDDVLRGYAAHLVTEAAKLQEAGDQDTSHKLIEQATQLSAQAEQISLARERYIKALSESVNSYQFQFDKPYMYNENLSQFPTSDPLREWDSAALGGGTMNQGFTFRRDILARAHLAYERNPIANASVTMTTRFSMGDGLDITYQNELVEETLEDFRTNPDNAIEEYEKTFCNDLQIDGELFIRVFTDSNGQVSISPLKPWEIWWIEFERGFPKRPISYHWVSQQINGVPGSLELVIEDIPAAQILHIAINRASYEIRGRPNLFRILPWLKAYKDWLEGRARQNHWRGALLWDVSLKDATATQVSTKRGQYKQPPSPGSLVIHNDKEAWTPLESKVGAADVSEDGRQMKLMSAVGAGLPEYFLSDGQNSNLASASAQQLPALRTFAEFQDIMINRVWRPIYVRVIEAAIAAGTLPEEVEQQDTDGDTVHEDPPPSKTPIDPPAPLMPNADGTITPPPPVKKPQGPVKKIDAIEAFDLSAPELEAEDMLKLMQGLAIAKNMGWVSDATASGEAGFDYTAEKKKIDAEKQADQNNNPLYNMAVDRKTIGAFTPPGEQPQPNGNGQQPQQPLPVKEPA